mgnify:CR=1 FL=1
MKAPSTPRKDHRHHEKRDGRSSDAIKRYGYDDPSMLGSRPAVWTWQRGLALALAAEAIARAGDKAPSYDTRAAIITARQTLAHGEVFVLGSPVPAGDSLAIALRPDGRLLAIAQTDGDIDLFDIPKQRRRDLSLVGHEGAVRALEFDGAGRSLVSAGVDGTVRLWSLRGAGIEQYATRTAEFDRVRQRRGAVRIGNDLRQPNVGIELRLLGAPGEQQPAATRESQRADAGAR